MNRRDFLQLLGIGTAVAMVPAGTAVLAPAISAATPEELAAPIKPGLWCNLGEVVEVTDILVQQPLLYDISNYDHQAWRECVRQFANTKVKVDGYVKRGMWPKLNNLFDQNSLTKWELKTDFRGHKVAWKFSGHLGQVSVSCLADGFPQQCQVVIFASGPVTLEAA